MENQNNYAEYYERNEQEILQSAIDAIDPCLLSYEEFIRLAGALKTEGFSLDTLNQIAAKDPRNKGTLHKKWPGINGSGSHGQAGKGTIYDYAKKSGWKWPTPDNNWKNNPRQDKPAKPQKPKLIAQYTDDFKISCIFDSQGYKSKPDGIGKIRNREKSPTPDPEPITIQDFANLIVQGYTFSPTIYNKEFIGYKEDGTREYKYRAIKQQVFIVDIDNEEKYKDENGKPHKRRVKDPLDIDKALEICKENDIAPFFVYETFSSKTHRDDKEAPYKKFRLCFAFKEPFTVQEHGERGIGEIINYFIGLFGVAADTSTTDTARLIFGTDEKDRAKLYKAVLDNNKFIKRLYENRNKDKDRDQDVLDKVQIESESAGYYMQSFFDEIKREHGTRETKTGFNDLDKILFGGLYPGLYNIGAVSSLGKTSFMLQIADNIARQGRHVLFFSLEMSRFELMAKSISRETAKHLQGTGQDLAGAFTTRDILNPNHYAEFTREQWDTLEQAKSNYDKYSKNLYIIEGVKRDKNGQIKQTGTRDILNRIKAHIAIYGDEQKPIVFIDYLQILAPHDIHYSDKMNIDHNILDLKQISRELNIVIIAINSFNRDSYYSPISLTSFKESGSIEYGSDVLLGLQYAGMDYQDNENEKDHKQRIKTLFTDQKEKGKQGQAQDIELKLLKDRNGAAETCYFKFYPKYNMFVSSDYAKPQQAAGHFRAEQKQIMPGEFIPIGTVIDGRREKQREKLKQAFIKAQENANITNTQVTLYDLAELLDVTQGTVKKMIKEFGGYTISQDNKIIFDGQVKADETINQIKAIV